VRLEKRTDTQRGITLRVVSTMAGDRKAAVGIASDPFEPRRATAERLIEARHELRAFVARPASS